MYTSEIRDTTGRFLPAKVLEALEDAWGYMEHKDYPVWLARESALANGVGRELTKEQINKFDEVLECY
jgi:hypothetical protein